MDTGKRVRLHILTEDVLGAMELRGYNAPQLAMMALIMGMSVGVEQAAWCVRVLKEASDADGGVMDEAERVRMAAELVRLTDEQARSMGLRIDDWG